MNSLPSFLRRSLGAKFSLFIGALLVPLFLLTGGLVMSVQNGAFQTLTEGVGAAFSGIREIDIKAAQAEEEAKIEKLGNLLSAIAPAAIASYDFMALIKYAQTAVETPGVCEVIYKTPDGKDMAKAQSKDHIEAMKSRSFDIINDGTKMGSVVVGYHSLLLEKKLAELDGVFTSKKQSLEEIQNAAKVNIVLSISLCLAGIGLLTIIVIVLLFRNFVSHPIDRSVANMADLTHGKLDIEIENAEREDEIGSIAQALEIFKTNALERQELQRHEREKDEQAKARAQKITALCSSFDTDIRNFLDGLENALFKLEEEARDLTQMASSTTTRARAISESSQTLNQSVSTVAGASNELSTSIREVSQQIHASTQMVHKTVEQTTLTAQQSELLMSYAQKVNDVLDLISGISHQTRLLSLNATIEAERAGEMGKGFAVVAGEVRVLAAQTEDSVKQIQQTITDVQTASSNISQALEQTRKNVDAVNNASSIMAAAAEQQTSATRNISTTIQQAAQATSSVAQSLGEIVNSASKTGEASAFVNEAAQTLTGKARELRRNVESFLKNVRSA